MIVYYFLMKRLFQNKLLFIVIAIFLFIVIKNKLNSSQSHSLVPIKSSTEIKAIGENNSGQLGISPTEVDEGEHTISNIGTITQVAAGRNFSLARTEEGNVYVWGGNDWGQLGLGIDESRKNEPTQNEKLKNIKKIATSNNHVLALSEDGHVYSFGSNFSGQLGTGDNNDKNIPVEVQGVDHIVDIAAGYKFSVAVKDDGTVWAWGAKCSDQQRKESEQWWKTVIGKTKEAADGYYDPNSDALSIYDKNEYCVNEDIVGILSRTSVQIKGLSNITQVSAGYGHVLALDTEGNVWSFGCNTFHQLGRVTKKTTDNTTPQKVNGLPKVNSISAGYRNSLALAEDGTVWSWGLNSHGQMGVETKDLLNIAPVKVSIDNVSQIFAGYDYALVIKRDRTVW